MYVVAPSLSDTSNLSFLPHLTVVTSWFDDRAFLVSQTFLPYLTLALSLFSSDSSSFLI